MGKAVTPGCKPVVCCVQVTQLVEFLIDHHEELFGEEVAGLAGTSPEESPAPAAEVCRGHKQRDNQSLPPQNGGLLPPQGQPRSSTNLWLCKSAEEG